MKDKDKLWVVLYLDVSKIGAESVNDYVSEVQKNWNYDDSVVLTVIPELKAREHPIEILQTPCVLFPPQNNHEKTVHRLNG